VNNFFFFERSYIPAEQHSTALLSLNGTLSPSWCSIKNAWCNKVHIAKSRMVEEGIEMITYFLKQISC